MKRSSKTLAALLFPLLVPSIGVAQCDLIDEDFDAVPLGTPIDNLNGWRDRFTSNNVFVETNPCNGTPAIVLDGSVRIAERRLSNLSTPEAFQISFDIAVWSDGNVRIVCPNVFMGQQVIMDTRMMAFFEITSGANVIRSGTATLPIVPGACENMTIFVDTLGQCRITYGGAVLNSFPWNTAASPGPCAAPESFAFLSNHSVPGPDMVIDNVCVSSAEWSRYCATNPNSSGETSAIGAFGSNSIAANDFVLNAAHLPPSVFGFFLAAPAQGFVPNPAGSQGNLCVSGPIGRFQQILFSDPQGLASMPVDWLQIPRPTGGPIPGIPGQTWNFQLYHRDTVAGSPATNFTGGLTVTLVP